MASVLKKGWVIAASVLFVLAVAAFAVVTLIRGEIDEKQRRYNILRTVNTANITYFSTYGRSFAPSLKALGSGDSSPCVATPEQSCLVDSVLASGRKSGYVITYTPGPRDKDGRITSYQVVAEPENPHGNDWRSYYSDESGIVRYELGRRATKSSPPL